MLKNNRFSIIFLLIVPILIGTGCEQKFRDQLTFDEIGFTVKDYSILPKQDLLVEAVNINTPSGFQSITAELSGQGDLSDPLRIPSADNEEKGYARFMYTAPDNEITASVTITVLENDGTKHVRTVTIEVEQKRNFPTIADFLTNTRYKFDDLYHIARTSDWWTADVVQEFEDPKLSPTYGFKSSLWEGTFFTVPDGALDPFLDLIVPENNLDIESWSDLNPANPSHVSIASHIIKSLNIRSRLASGSRAFPPDSIGKGYPKGYQLLYERFGYMKIDDSDFTVGRVGRAINTETGVQPDVYYPHAKIQTEYDSISQDSVLYSFRIAGGYGYNLTDFFVDLDFFDGAFYPEKTFRANAILAMMGFDEITFSGMNGFDPSYNLAAAKSNFYGSAYWEGTLFVPYNDLVATTYESANTSNGWGITSFTEEWNWHNRTDIPDEQMEFMMNFWGSHNIKDETSKSLSGPYKTNNGNEDIYVAGGNTISRIENSEVVATAKILKSVRFFDGGIDKFKVIHVIDDVLWLP